MKKKMRKITDKSLLKIWGEIVKERANWKCEYPDCMVNAMQLHPHHFYSRKHASIRYDPSNGLCLCSHHHTLGSFSAHQDPDFKDRIISTGVRTPEWRERLLIQRSVIVKNNQTFKDEWQKKLKLYF